MVLNHRLGEIKLNIHHFLYTLYTTWYKRFEYEDIFGLDMSYSTGAFYDNNCLNTGTIM